VYICTSDYYNPHLNIVEYLLYYNAVFLTELQRIVMTLPCHPTFIFLVRET